MQIICTVYAETMPIRLSRPIQAGCSLRVTTGNLPAARGPHLPGGPWEPAGSTKCDSGDSCATLFEKLQARITQIQSHERWDTAHPDACYPQGRHELELWDLKNGLAKCWAIYEANCRKQDCATCPFACPCRVERMLGSFRTGGTCRRRTGVQSDVMVPTLFRLPSECAYSVVLPPFLATLPVNILSP